MMMRVILLDMLNMRERETTPYTIHYDDVNLQDMLKRERETTPYSLMMHVILLDMLNMRERDKQQHTL